MGLIVYHFLWGGSTVNQRWFSIELIRSADSCNLRTDECALHVRLHTFKTANLAEILKVIECVVQVSASAESTQENAGEWLQQVPLSEADIA